MIDAENQKRIDDLCAKIVVEKDPGKVAELARELNKLLASNESEAERKQT
jgi:hypothetical protein